MLHALATRKAFASPGDCNIQYLYPDKASSNDSQPQASQGADAMFYALLLLLSFGCPAWRSYWPSKVALAVSRAFPNDGNGDASDKRDHSAHDKVSFVLLPSSRMHRIVSIVESQWNFRDLQRRVGEALAEDVDSFRESDGMIARRYESCFEAGFGRIADLNDSFHTFCYSARIEFPRRNFSRPVPAYVDGGPQMSAGIGRYKRFRQWL